jgi:predicted transcriptional regulator
VFSVRPDETVYDSIKKMVDKNIGSLTVMEGDKLVGHHCGTPLCPERGVERPRITQDSRPRHYGNERGFCAT